MNAHTDVLLAALVAVLQDAQSGCIRSPGTGICCNAYIVANYPGPPSEFYEALGSLWEDWPEHSGIQQHPILPISARYRWEGEQLAARVRLLEYSIAKLRGRT